MADPPRRALFGLRTNVGYFASRVGFAKLDVRLRAAALLYDEVLLEGGVYTSTITDDGSMDSVTAPQGPEDLEPIRTRRGTIAGMRMAITGSNDFRTMLAGKTEQSFRSQFHSRFDAIPDPKPSWIQLIELHPDAERHAKKLTSDWSWSERDAVKELFPGRSHWFREKLHGNINFDLAQASVVRADLLPDGLNVKLPAELLQRAVEPRERGVASRALGIVELWLVVTGRSGAALSER